MTAAAGLTAEFAPAKINLALHVTGRRADGYHTLESLVVFADVGDRLTVSPAAEDGFAVTGPMAAAVPTDEGNLVVRARDRLRAVHPSAGPVSILLEKRLPVASGIGGGSADAAAALRALARHWRFDVTTDEIRVIAAELGADVPMCLDGRPLVASGVGDRLAPLAAFPFLSMVLVNPGVAVATADVFRALERRDNPPLPALPDEIDRPGLSAWLEATRNDLEAPARAIAPAIGDALAALADAGATFVRMSGSGATCFGLYPGMQDARRAADALLRRRPGWWVEATLCGGSA